ncbi:hypothetical protein GCM10027258_10350 [Amycolatopsis stemonae]
MPENDQPMWPSSDEDRSSSGARKTTPMSLPDPPESPPDRPGVPNVTGSEAPKGSWFAPNVEPEPIPGLNVPAEEPAPPPTPAKQDLADRLGSRDPKPVGAKPAEPAPTAENTQFIEVEQPPKKAPWVPVERNVWPAEQQDRHEEPQTEKPESQPWREELQLWREEQQRREEQLQRADQQRREESQPRTEEPQPRRDEPQPPREEPQARQEEQPRRDEPQPRREEPQAYRDEPQARRDEQPRRDEPQPRGEETQQLRPQQPQRPQEPQPPWAQRVDVADGRPALPPEPPRGVVPPASAGSLARPMRIEPDGQRFDAEATVGIERPTQFPGAFQQQPQQRGEPPAEPPATPPAATAEEPPKKKRRKGKIIALVVVVLLVLAGGGIAAAMPKVSNRLGLPWAPNAPKGDSPEPAAATRQLQGPDTSGQAPTANGVKSALAGAAANSALGQLNGSVVDPVTGTTLWDHSSATAVTPASTTKVLTSAAALLALDPNTRLSTKIVQGADPGTVILVGGGDVTLTGLPLGTESPLYPGAAHVDDLVAQVKKANPGVKKVQVDLSLFKGATTAPGWAAGDAPSTFATQIGSVMADAGRLDPKNNNSQRAPNAGSALASTIASKLSASPGGQATAPKDAKVLAEVKSAPLTELVSDTMELSDDVLAEALARQVALASGQEASFAGGAAATLKVLKDHGFDTSGVKLSDGSGISTENKIPAKLLTQLMAAAAAPEGKNENTAKLRPMLAGLPVAGGSGTLADKRFETPASQAGRGWVRAKTGTLTGVNTLAGLVLDQDGRVLVFAFMSNGSDQQPGRDAIDALATSLRKCGCS